MADVVRLGDSFTEFGTMSVVLITGIVAIATIALYLFLTWKVDYWKKRGVVGPSPTFFYGNIKDLVLRKGPIHFAFLDAYNEYPNEKYVGLFRLRNPVLLVRDLEIIKNIMIKDFDYFMDRGIEFSEKGLGLNLFHSNSDTWKVLRNKFSPTFTSGKLKNMFHLLHDRGDTFVEYVNKTVKEKELDVYPLLQKYMESAISSCAFGIDLDFYNEEMFDQLSEIGDMVVKNTYMNELEMMFPGVLKKLDLDLFPNAVSSFFSKLVKDILAQRKGVPSNRRDFMDLIIEIKNNGEIQGNKGINDETKVIKIDDALIAANVFLFFVAGFETSATTMAFMMHELAHNPEIQNRLEEEITEVLERHGGKLSYEALSEMTYLSQVFDETLRMYPVGDPLTRVAKKDYQIPGSDLIIEKDVHIAVSVRGIHYDPNYYPEPHKFDPERFAPEIAKSRHAAAYLPFGIGPRNCIGMRFAQVASKVCMAKLLSKFRAELGSSTTYELPYDPYRLTLRSKKGIPLKLIPRSY